jgi:uncharacterized membrane protein YhaH (DUF805 family)
MNFQQAIQSGFSNYVNFSGRAARSEDWFWIVFYLLAVVVTLAIDTMIGFRLTLSIFAIAVLLPTIAVQVRRLHDLDRTGWWILLHFVPLVGAIVLIIWYCMRGTEGPNRFGPDPLAGVGQISPRPAI